MTLPTRRNATRLNIVQRSKPYGAIAAAVTIGNFMSIFLPFEIGLMIDQLHISPATSGLVATLQFVVLALANFLLAPFIARIPLRPLAYLGVAVVLVSLALAAFSSGGGPYIFASILMGLGFGIVYATSNAGAATSPFPRRSYAFALGFSIIVYMVASVLLSHAISLRAFIPWASGHIPPYLVMFAFILVLSPGLLLLGGAATTTGVVKTPRRAFREYFKPEFLAMVAIMALYSAPERGLYAFLQRRAIAVGMEPADFGFLLSISIALSIFGTLAAGLLKRSFGIAWPVMIALALVGFCGLITTIATAPAVFIVFAILNSIVWYFAYALLLALGAALDATGRAAALLGGVYLLGQGVGVAFGGAMIQLGGFALLGWLVFSSCIVVAAMAYFVGATVETQRSI